MDPPPPVAATGHRYDAYGLTIDSDFALPGVRPAERGPTEAAVRFARRAPSGPPPAAPFAYSDDGDRQLLTWGRVGRFTLASDDHVDIEPNPGVSDEIVALPLLGAVTAALLHRRGAYVLHASAVDVGGIGVALVGDKGAGKSTTAALMLARGHQLLTDDIVALDFAAGSPRILPAGSTEMKLWPQSVAALEGLGLGAGRSWHQDISKASYGLEGNVAEASAPLGAIYVLSRGGAASITPLHPPEAIALLLRFSYQARYGQMGFGARLGEHFAQSGFLAKQALVRTLCVPEGLDCAGDSVALIEADVRHSRV